RSHSAATARRCAAWACATGSESRSASSRPTAGPTRSTWPSAATRGTASSCGGSSPSDRRPVRWTVMPRAVLIVNPFSSKVNERRVEDVEYALGESMEVVTRPTEARGHATELAREAAREADAVGGFSGDGTYNQAINGA